jgi:hypothetical protein
MHLSRGNSRAHRGSNADTLTMAAMLPELILAIAAGTFAMLLTVADRFERRSTAEARVTTRYRPRQRR